MNRWEKIKDAVLDTFSDTYSLKKSYELRKRSKDYQLQQYYQYNNLVYEAVDIPITEELVRYYPTKWSKVPYTIKAPRDYQIRGTPIFVKSVMRLLNELREKAPARYEEAMIFMPRVCYEPEVKYHHFWEDHPNWQARADASGKFAIDGSDYQEFRFVFLHELGHNVYLNPSNDYCLDYNERVYHGKHAEEEANEYAWQVLAELDNA